MEKYWKRFVNRKPNTRKEYVTYRRNDNSIRRNTIRRRRARRRRRVRRAERFFFFGAIRAAVRPRPIILSALQYRDGHVLIRTRLHFAPDPGVCMISPWIRSEERKQKTEVSAENYSRKKKYRSSAVRYLLASLKNHCRCSVYPFVFRSRKNGKFFLHVYIIFYFSSIRPSCYGAVGFSSVYFVVGGV